MNLFVKYKFEFISIVLMILVIGFLFQKPITGEYIFGGADSLSPSAIKQGIVLSEKEYNTYPLWLPWVFSGLPSVHSFQNISDHYFPNIIFKILISTGLPSFWIYIFHFLIAGMGTYALLRKIEINHFGALFGGISFILMPYLITMVVHGHGSQMMTTAWLPWIIWGVLNIYNKVNLTNIGLLGILVGFQLQRGHVQIAYYTWMASGLLIVLLLFKNKENLKNQLKWLTFTIWGLILGLLMSMSIYLPALNYSPYSIRGAGGGVSFDYATAWSFSFGEMATFFIPSFYGFGGPTYWGSMPFTDYPNYMGIIVLCISIIGILFHKNTIKWFFMTMGLLALFISLGNNFFLYQILYEYFPYFNKFRVPSMFLILTQFSVSILAGMGLDIIINWIKNTTKNTNKLKDSNEYKQFIWIFFCFILFVLVLGTISLNPQDFGSRSHYILNNLRTEMKNIDTVRSITFLFILLSIIIICKYKKEIIKNNSIYLSLICSLIIFISIIDLSIVNNQIINPNKSTYRNSTMINRLFKSNYLNQDDIIKFLKKDTSKYRILPLGSLANENRWSAFHIESIEGYHPAKLFSYNKIKNEVGWNYMGILKMLNVKYLISLDELSHPSFINVFNGKIFHQGNYKNAYIYRFKDDLPRLFFTQNSKIIPDINNQLKILKTKDYNPEELVLLEKEISNFSYDANASVNIISWSPDKIEINTQLDSDQLLILSEVYYPMGWEITSHPNWEILKVNSILRGILVPKGNHVIVIEFSPNDIKYGTILSFSSFIILILLLMSSFTRKK